MVAPRDPALHVAPPLRPRLVEALRSRALHMHLDGALSALLTQAAQRIEQLETALLEAHRAIRASLPPDSD